MHLRPGRQRDKCSAVHRPVWDRSRVCTQDPMANVCPANVRFEPEITVWTGGIWHYGLLTLVTRCIDICTEYFVRREPPRGTHLVVNIRCCIPRGPYLLVPEFLSLSQSFNEFCRCVQLVLSDRFLGCWVKSHPY